jgi:small subunit ribosomal protein S20
MRQAANQRIRNRAFRSQLRAAIKDVRTETSQEEAAKKFRLAVRLIDRAAATHIIHRRTADRNKSRLALHVNRLG